MKADKTKHRPLTVLCALIITSNAFATDIVDQRGKKVDIVTPAQRVVYIPPAVSNYLTVAGSDKSLVGSSSFATRMVKNGLLAKIFPNAVSAKDVTSNGWFTPNIEAILAAKPDVVFQTAMKGAEFYEPIEKAGLKVVCISGANGEKDDVTWAGLAGIVSGNAKRSEQIIKRFDTEATRLTKEIGAIKIQKRPKILHIMKVDSFEPMIGDIAFNQAVKRVGAVNVTDGLNVRGPVSFEQILVWNPDVILISGWPEEKHIPDDLYKSPLWQKLSAVKAHKVYKVPLGGHRFQGIVELPLFWQWLAEILYPQQIQHRFRTMFRETYQSIYGYKLGDDEIDQAIYMQANKQSAEYLRFAR